MIQIAKVTKGDHVLLLMKDSAGPYLTDVMSEGLEQMFPGVEFTFVEGVTGALVISGEGEA